MNREGGRDNKSIEGWGGLTIKGWGSINDGFGLWIGGGSGNTPSYKMSTETMIEKDYGYIEDARDQVENLKFILKKCLTFR